ncbi:MAG: response regulator [Chloroflexi bacterium]|nr:response regulator [Chloroflexota bacterium]
MNNKTILYIEDNPHNRRIVRKILGTQGYSVIEAEDGLVGYNMIRELKPPLVLLDISLPSMHGIQIVGNVKADEDLWHIPVIALTASAMSGDRERFLEAGCDEYLSKPVQAFKLISMVNSYYPENNIVEDKHLDVSAASIDRKPRYF